MAIPTLEFRPRSRRAAPSPVHSDVAGFIGQTRRGPVGAAIRVEGWRRFERLFGGLDSNRLLTYALRGYFENGGQVAYVVRVAGGTPRPAEVDWMVPTRVALIEYDRNEYPLRYTIRASSPGLWGEGMRIQWDWRHGAGRFVVTAAGEEPEYLANLDERVTDGDQGKGRGLTLQNRIRVDSNLIELVETADAERFCNNLQRTGTLELHLAAGAAERAPTLTDYVAAAQALGDEPEVAIIAIPGLYQDLSAADQREMRLALLRQAVELQDRLVILDPPNADARTVAEFAADLRKGNDWDGVRRGGAVYGPWLRVSDPFGGVANPLKAIPASGHIAGVISRLDRERGAHHTPANVALLDAVDLDQRLDEADEVQLNDAGVNLIRCRPGRGLMVWGGRTVDPEPEARFVAHRRLIHRLVRAIRKVAEPVVFDTNGPALWLAFTRAITTVLLEAFRAGALKGDRPDDAFRVQCDDKTNPEEQIETGRVVCLIQLAPAVPMEFITLRVALSENKQVEVFDA